MKAEVRLRYGVEWQGAGKVRGRVRWVEHGSWLRVEEVEVWSVPVGREHYPSWWAPAKRSVVFPRESVESVTPLAGDAG